MLRSFIKTIYRPEFADPILSEEDYVLFSDDAHFQVLPDQQGFHLPEVKDVPVQRDKLRYLFYADRAVYLHQGLLTDSGLETVSFHGLRKLKACSAMFICSTAMHMLNWEKQNVYCGACGHTMQDSKKERARQCPSCGLTVYPRINPAVICAVLNGDKILLTHAAARPGAPWALVSGYCEIGESNEETCAREVMEETGLRIRNLRYYGSQAWGFSESLLTGYVADLDGDGQARLLDGELDRAKWFTAEEIRQDGIADDGISLTREMIGRFAAGTLV